MEEIVQEIIRRLLKRMNSSYFCSAADCSFLFDEQTFVKHENILVKDVDVVLLEDIMSHKSTEWVKWILKSFDFPCHLSLQLSFDNLNLLPKNFLRTMPLSLYTIDGQRLVFSKYKIATYQEVALWTENDCLVLNYNQSLTDFAKDKISQNKIKVYRREW
ncbi:MAG: PduM family microcompartment protein [Streptococcaceae bacterium]|nr:PduM family microcompartment protein [Streptococcaceae bacterium]